MQGSPWCVQYQAVWYHNRMPAPLCKDGFLQLPHTSLHWCVRVKGTKETAKLQTSVYKDPTGAPSAKPPVSLTNVTPFQWGVVVWHPPRPLTCTTIRRD